MEWTPEPVKHLLEITSIRDGQIRDVTYKEYTPEQFGSHVSLYLSNQDAELRVKPYTIENLTFSIGKDDESVGLNELVAGIRDEKNMEYIGILWKCENSHKKMNQYFFRNDEPSSFNFGHMSGPKWPLNQGPVLNDELVQYFNTLKEVRPNVTESLDNCMVHLTKSDPEYSGDRDESILIK